MTAPIRVVLVDDHAVVRAGYRGLLQDSGRIEVVGEASGAAGAYRLYCELTPDVVVMDISLPGGSGIAALKQILARAARARVLMFSMHEDAIFASHAMRAGARGYITKSSAPEVLVDAVLSVAAGRTFLGTDIARTLALADVSSQGNVLDSLTEREFDVLRLFLDGRSTSEVAQALNLSRKSVANHRWAIKQKTGVDNFMQLLHVAMRMGIAPDGLSSALPAERPLRDGRNSDD
ncbi:MAG: response regulator transcription factor [Rhodanobacter sp.]